MNTNENRESGQLSVTRNLSINLPAADTWKLMGGFGSLENWHPAIARTQIVKGIDNTPGAVRKLTLLDGSTLQEQLTAYDTAAMRLEYKITAGTFPASDYRSKLTVTPAGNDYASLVTWHGEFRRTDPAETPLPGGSDQAAIEAVTHVYETGLESIGKLAIETLSIQRVIGLYADGGTRGDAGMVSRAFHRSATMKFVKNGELVDEPIAAFLKNYIPAGVRQDRQVRIDYIDIRGTAASARLTIDYPTHQFVDYFNLLKLEGEWFVVSKIFHRIAR